MISYVIKVGEGRLWVVKVSVVGMYSIERCAKLKAPSSYFN